MEHPSTQPDLFLLSGESPLAANESAYAITLGDRIAPYVLRRARRRTLVLSIDHRGLRVGGPLRVTLAEVEAFIRKNEAWVAKKLDEWRSSRRPEHLKITEGMRLPLLGGNLLIHLSSGNNQAHWDEPFPSTLTLFLRAPTDAAHVLEKAFRERARNLFMERLVLYSQKLALDTPPLSISAARTRWGSCSLRTGIRLNWRLLHFPLRLVDYVVVHELSHLHEMNHSRRFWAIVGDVLPEYRALRGELRKLSAECPRW